MPMRAHAMCLCSALLCHAMRVVFAVWSLVSYLLLSAFFAVRSLQLGLCSLVFAMQSLQCGLCSVVFGQLPVLVSYQQCGLCSAACHQLDAISRPKSASHNQPRQEHQADGEQQHAVVPRVLVVVVGAEQQYASSVSQTNKGFKLKALFILLAIKL